MRTDNALQASNEGGLLFNRRLSFVGGWPSRRPLVTLGLTLGTPTVRGPDALGTGQKPRCHTSDQSHLNSLEDLES